MTAVRRIAGALRGLPVHAKGTRDRMTMPILTREPGRGAGTRTRARADRAPCACRTPATGATRADGKAVPRTGGMSPRRRARSSSRPILPVRPPMRERWRAWTRWRRGPKYGDSPRTRTPCGPDVAPRGAGHSLGDGDSGTVCPVGRPATGHAV